MQGDVTFKHPPVVETVLGVQFERLRGLTNAHLGAFWQQKRAEWTQIADAAPLEEQFETFGKQVAWNQAVHLRLTQSPAARMQMRNETGDRMIQLQNCRLDYNWIGQPGQAYPRYRTVRPEFDGALREFKAFADEHGLGQLVPTQWEVTYVNHLLKGTVWAEPEEWPGLFRSLPGAAIVPEGVQLESFGGHWHFRIEPERGRLHVELQHAYIGGGDRNEALVIKLTARGPMEMGKDGDPIAGIDRGLDLGHDVIVRSFAELTSERAHAYWNREKHDASR